MEPTPSEPKAPEPSAPAPGAPNVHTYHCLCTNLILASTTPLAQLQQRSADSLDKAYILPLPPPPESDQSSESPAKHYAMLLSTVLDRKPQVVTRSDGFEKRWLQRCNRCRLIVGYQLDWSQYSGAPNAAFVGDDEEAKGHAGRRADVVYVLPDGLLTTADMAAGKRNPANGT